MTGCCCYCADDQVCRCRYVYQKAYVEFFVSPANFKALEPRLKASPAITYMAVNAKGDLIANVGPTDVNAVTWGVFPAKEVIQPTVVDPHSFAIWKVPALPTRFTLQTRECICELAPLTGADLKLV